ncbi:hypothetical protein NEF87_000857 [Candidatus Lokiarchaeum ossiferum]|uniref:Uncharacterized protein n=1 Tax=Candidatus Lokiarchaeum ossiferum TaxID=2951803 RepID=A0ABY6HQB6_9ARCH|nr:hypothetical protein NEF87_000857 [Candidatus Lokiarchaeum sp. B-35]
MSFILDFLLEISNHNISTISHEKHEKNKTKFNLMLYEKLEWE